MSCQRTVRGGICCKLQSALPFGLPLAQGNVINLRSARVRFTQKTTGTRTRLVGAGLCYARRKAVVLTELSGEFVCSFLFVRRGRRLCRPVWEVTNSPKSSVKTDCSARADVGIGPYNEIWWCTRGASVYAFRPCLLQPLSQGSRYSAVSSAAVSGSCISSKAFCASSKITCTSANASCRRERPVDRSAASAAISSPESM